MSKKKNKKKSNPQVMNNSTYTSNNSTSIEKDNLVNNDNTNFHSYSKLVSFCDTLLFSSHKFSDDEIFDSIKDFLTAKYNMPRDLTNKQVNKLVLDSYYYTYEAKIQKLHSSNTTNKNDMVFSIFEHFKNFPAIQHQIGKIIYKEEISNCAEIFSIQIPLSKNAHDILQERLKNIDKYAKFAKTIKFNGSQNAKNKIYNVKYGNNIGIIDDVLIADIKNNSITKKLNQDGHAYIFEKNEVADLLNTKKILVTKPIYALHRIDHIVKTSYYIGEYKGQDILFCERIFYSNDMNSACSYSFGFYPGGNLKDFVFLTRADYNVEHSHFDKLISGIEPNCEKTYEPYDKFDANINYNIRDVLPNNSYYNVEDQKLIAEAQMLEAGIPVENPTKVYKAHIHMSDSIYSILFPTRANHADAVIIPNKNVFNKSYKDLYNYAKNHDFRDREDYFDFFNRTSHETVPDFEHLVKLMKNITKTTSNENIICKTCDISKGNVDALNNLDCKDETISYDLSNITQPLKKAYEEYKTSMLNQGEYEYEN